MTREELLLLVDGKVSTAKLDALSQRTINEELDDVLEDFGDDEEANDKIVTKLANRLKRMNGNVHKNASDEVKKHNDAEEERKRKEEEDRKRKERENGNGKPDTDSKYDELLAEIKAIKAANEARDKKAAKDATVESIKRGLKGKFDKAGLEMNDFFLETALSKLEIPDENADISDLVSKAEGIYTADYKAATGQTGIPKKGHGNQPEGISSEDDKFMDEIVARRKRKYGDDDAKK